MVSNDNSMGSVSTAGSVELVSERYSTGDFAKRLGENFMDDMAVYVRQSHVTPTETKRHPGVVHSQEVQHCGVQVVDFLFVFDRFVTVLIGLPVNRTAFDASSRQPHTESEGVVIASVRTLGERCTTKFPGPDDECFVKQTPVFQVGQ